MGKSLNLAMVGCGDIAGYMAQVSRLVPAVRLAACCDIHPAKAEAFARRYRVPDIYHDYQEMLSQNNTIHAVYLAVPHHLHLSMILAAVERKLPVLVEKPLTRTLEEGLQLVDLLRSKGSRVGVNYQYRYDRGCYALARAIQNGALGKVHSVRINIPWHRELAYFESSPWHKTLAEAGGGTLITQGSHFLDIALWALSEKPVAGFGVTARPVFDVEVETLAHGIVETEGGTVISIVSSMVAAREGAVSIEMYGQQGTAIYSNKPYPHVRFSGVSPRRERPPVRGVHALQRSLTGFARWALQNDPYLIPVEEALPTLAAVEAVYRSAQSNRMEEIKMTHQAGRKEHKDLTG
jgi:predicted dehydrogenase